MKIQETETIGVIEKLAYSVEEISETTSLSKSFLRNEIRARRLKIKRIGRRVLVMKKDLLNFLENESEGEAN